MEEKCGIFVVKRLHFSNILDYIWTWTLHLKKFWIVFGLGLSFKKSGLDLDRKIWLSAHLCCRSHYHLMLSHKTYQNLGICFVTIAYCYITKRLWPALNFLMWEWPATLKRLGRPGMDYWMHYAFKNSKGSAPVPPKVHSRATYRYVCIGVWNVYLVARCTSTHKTCFADISQQSRSFQYSHWSFLWLILKSWDLKPALIYDGLV